MSHTGGLKPYMRVSHDVAEREVVHFNPPEWHMALSNDSGCLGWINIRHQVTFCIINIEMILLVC